MAHSSIPRLSPSLALLLVLGACGGPNQVPTRPEIDIEPAMPYTTDDLHLVITKPAEDPDGDGVLYHTRWFEDGELRPDVHGDVVPAERTAAGGYWIAELWATDGQLEGPVAEATAYVFNSLPEATVSVGPREPDTRVDLIARARATDLDGDSVTFDYGWRVDGEDSPHTGASIPAADTVKGQSWEVTATPFDGDSWGVPGSAAVSIGNALPSRPVVGLEPAEPVAREGFLRCVLLEAAEDPDGDALGYHLAWWVDGEPFAEAVTTELEGDTVPPWATAPGQRWECQLWADDGEGEGPPGRASAIL